MISGVLILILWGTTPALAQLPPEIQADSYLLRAEQALGEGDPARARAEIDKIILLQAEHELDLTEEFHFRYAKTAAAAGLPEQAHKAVVKYLTMAGREGRHYVEALELMNQVQDAIEVQKEPQATSTGLLPTAQEASQVPSESQLRADGTQAEPDEKQAVITAAELTEVQAEPGCDLQKWQMKGFFQAATVQDVKACLEAGADPNARDKEKERPLHWAAGLNENPAVVQALMSAGADPKARDEDSWTPLHWAAAFNENPAVMKALLDAGPDSPKKQLKKKSLKGWTLLHCAAAFNENPAAVKFLLAAGANLNAQSMGAYTPLHLASIHNENPAMIKTLVAAGADPNGFSPWGMPLHLAAAHSENLAVIKALLDAGADLRARTRVLFSGRGRTPLHSAAEFTDHPDTIKFLLDAGADLEVRDGNGRTPMYAAARDNENLATIQALIAAGANLNARNDDGKTPLDVAIKNENPAVQEILRAAGAKKMPKQGGGSGFGALVAGMALGATAVAAGANAEDASEAAVVFAEQVRTGQPSTGSVGIAGTAGGGMSVGGSCEITGYPSPPGGVANLGLSWCPASVDFQVRAFALQAAGAQCAIATGSSSTPEQIQARRREISAACGRLAALGAPDCQCSPGSGGPGFSQDSSAIDREQQRREQQAQRQEEARQAAQREKLRIEAKNARVMSSNCSCIGIDDKTGEYTCLDGLVVGNNSSGKPLCDIRR